MPVGTGPTRSNPAIPVIWTAAGRQLLFGGPRVRATAAQRVSKPAHTLLDELDLVRLVGLAQPLLALLLAESHDRGLQFLHLRPVDRDLGVELLGQAFTILREDATRLGQLHGRHRDLRGVSAAGVPAALVDRLRGGTDPASRDRIRSMGTELAPYHSPPADLTPGHSRVIWSEQPTGHLLLFVHGVRGFPTMRTWGWFEFEIETREGWAGWDLIFYDYKSTRAVPGDTAKLICDLLRDLFTDPAKVFARSCGGQPERSDDFTYKRAIIVAHSLGALIARRALINAVKRRGREGDPEWAEKSELVLLGPAHKGANLAALFWDLMEPHRVLTLGSRQICPALEDLRPESDAIRELEQDAQSVLSFRGGRCLRARRVVFGEIDNVVRRGQFLEDRDHDVIPETGHLRSCKPTRGFSDPLKYLEAARDE